TEVYGSTSWPHTAGRSRPTRAGPELHRGFRSADIGKATGTSGGSSLRQWSAGPVAPLKRSHMMPTEVREEGRHGETEFVLTARPCPLLRLRPHTPPQLVPGLLRSREGHGDPRRVQRSPWARSSQGLDRHASAPVPDPTRPERAPPDWTGG